MTTPGRIMIGPPGTQPTSGMEGWTQVGYVTGPTALTLDSPPPDDAERRTLTCLHGTITCESIKVTQFGRTWMGDIAAAFRKHDRRITAMHTAYRAKTRRRNRRRK